MSDGGKGSNRRLTQISEEQFAKNWDLIFGTKNTNNQTEEIKTEEIDDVPNIQEVQ